VEKKAAKAPGAIDPTGRRNAALDAFLTAKVQQGFEIEAHTGTHAIIVGRERPGGVLRRLRRRKRFVVSVDEHGNEVTMIPAERVRT
jgi:hypothetical protein